MDANAKPQLDSKWWSKNKPSSFKKTGSLKKLLDMLDNQNSDFAKIFDPVFPAAANFSLAGVEETKTTLETFNTALGLAFGRERSVGNRDRLTSTPVEKGGIA